jgi:hypothetical protein
MLAAMMIVAGCAGHRRTADPAAVLTGWTVNPRDGRLTSLAVDVGTMPLRNAQFFVATDLEGAYWRTTAEPRGRVLLRPLTQTFIPYAGDNVFVYAENGDRRSRRQLLVQRVESAAAGIVNPDFQLWRLGYWVPTGWHREGDSSTVAKRVVLAGRRALQFRADAKPSGDQEGFIAQPLPARNLHFSYDVFPDEDCDAAADPSALAGVQVVDAVFNRVTYCIDSHVKSPRVIEIANQNLVVLLPGRLHAWNHVDTSVEDLLALVHFVPDEYGMVDVGPAVRLHHSADGAMPQSIDAGFTNFRLLR